MTEKEKKQNPSSDFEFCKVCKLNHNQGRRHNYFPNHKKSLSSFLSRFLNKLSDVRFFIKNPIVLSPEFAPRNRLWCVFCDSDIQELDSLFACCNAIHHLASSEHFKSLKHFLWKYGGGMDRVDSFRVSESDLAQWEKKCKTLKSSSAFSYGGHLLGQSKDIHNQLNSDNINNFEQNANNSFNFNSNGFLPLQIFTNERHQVSHREDSEVAHTCTPLNGAISLSVGMHNNMYSHGMHSMESTTKDLKVYRDNQHTLVSSYSNSLVGPSSNKGGVQQVGGLTNVESRNQVLQSLTQISPLQSEKSKANVHTGAPPPWLYTNEDSQLNAQVSTGSHVNGSASSLKKSGKSQKLNPKRVGAAWAEKRKIELEMEKRGEIVRNSFDPNWLPNFGRVWQSGSRKESKKEFEMEKQKPVEVDNFSEAPIKLQPYISKRMRKDAAGSMDDVNGHFGGVMNSLQPLQ